MNWIKVECNTYEEYLEGTKNLKKAGFELTENTFSSDHWDKNNTRFWVLKNW